MAYNVAYNPNPDRAGWLGTIWDDCPLRLRHSRHYLHSNVLDKFLYAVYRPAMPDAPQLRPATPDEIAETLSFALPYDGRKRVHHADDAMARITAERLVRHLERSGFVQMKRSPTAPPATANMPSAVRD